MIGALLVSSTMLGVIELLPQSYSGNQPLLRMFHTGIVMYVQTVCHHCQFAATCG